MFGAKSKEHFAKKTKIETPKKILNSKNCQFFIKEVDFYKKYFFVYSIIYSCFGLHAWALPYFCLRRGKASAEAKRSGAVKFYIITDNTIFSFEKIEIV